MNIRERNELTVAYLQTEYSIEFPEGKIWISPLSDNSGLVGHLGKLKVETWAAITPFNPGFVAVSDAENDRRLGQFERDELLERKDLQKFEYFRSTSRPKDHGAKGEDGFWIANIFPWDAIRMGHRWGQNAIVIGRSDGFAEIQWCDHESQIFFSRAGNSK